MTLELQPLISELHWFVSATGFFALVYGLFIALLVLKSPTGNEQMNRIALAIQEGANAYLKRQYKTIAIVGIIFVLGLYFLLGIYAAIGFFLGALLSGLAGFIGMWVSVRANVRTAEASRHGLAAALNIAFRAGSVTGFLVVGLALLGISSYFFILESSVHLPNRTVTEALVSLGFGASLISIFARLGGGIFTKGADIGADLVGKLEEKIPEDDPRNPAVIADNVGDNVGDCAGMSADLFETYAVTMAATMILAEILATNNIKQTLMIYPLAIGGACIIGSILGNFFVRLGKTQNIMNALYKGVFAASIISGILIFFLTKVLFGLHDSILLGNQSHTGLELIYCAFAGLVVTTLLVLITEYYTSKSFRPVVSVAEASTTGHATNIIQGLAVSLEATALPVLVICAGILITYLIAGLFGIAIAVTTMVGLAGTIITLDAYGPVTDNAGGIAEMTHMDEKIRKITDSLDAVGNTTKATTKGFAIGSAGLAALVLFAVFIEDLKYYFPSLKVNFDLQNPFIVIGLFIGALLPYIFSSLAMKAVGKTGGQIVLEVRRQFREIKGILAGTARPQYGIAIDLLTKAAIKEMIIPSLLPVFSPILLYMVIDIISGKEAAFASLGALLLGTIASGLLLAISMTSGGAAWDNAKKYIEDGNLGGKGSDAHRAAVTGDTVGDPYKDTAGPAINPMIKIINMVALLLMASLARLIS